MDYTAPELVTRLQLLRHPEGGWYRETYRAAEQIAGSALPERFGGDRALSTAIYFLLEPGDFSALHRIKADELWHYYGGSSVLVHRIDPDGSYHRLQLGPRLAAGEQFQLMVPAGCWFGAEPVGTGYALVGCTVAPGFDFTDFELAERAQLISCYPQHAELITRLTRV